MWKHAFWPMFPHLSFTRGVIWRIKGKITAQFRIFPCVFPCVSLIFPCFPSKHDHSRGKSCKTQLCDIIFALRLKGGLLSSFE